MRYRQLGRSGPTVSVLALGTRLFGRTCDLGLAAPDGPLSPLQEAFIRHGGFQCGICTPGQIVAATALLREQPRPAAEDVREWMMGDLCRCTGYEGILAAILPASASEPA